MSFFGATADGQDLPGSVILATGDEVPGLGRVGIDGFYVLGMDDLGRALFASDDSPARLFWADGERFEAAVECSAGCPRDLYLVDSSFAGPFALTGYPAQIDHFPARSSASPILVGLAVLLWLRRGRSAES